MPPFASTTHVGLIQVLGPMPRLPLIFAAVAATSVIVGIAVLLARKSQKQFAVGSLLVFLAAFGFAIFYPVEIYSSGQFWMDGYTTLFLAIATLYAIAQLAIWRGFSKPGWLSFFCTLPLSLLVASAGFWSSIQ